MKQKELDKIKEDTIKGKITENNMADHYNYKFAAETKIRELEQENRKNYEEKQRFEIDYRVLVERHNELKKNQMATEVELNLLKTKQNEELILLETKLVKMTQELDFIQRENNNLRINEERLRAEISNLEKQRDNFSDKYHDYKGKCNILNSKLEEVIIFYIKS